MRWWHHNNDKNKSNNMCVPNILLIRCVFTSYETKIVFQNAYFFLFIFSMLILLMESHKNLPVGVPNFDSL